MKEFAGKVAGITGAANGIGEAFALEAARRGMNLALIDLESDRLQEVKKECEALGAPKVVTITVDVSEYEQVRMSVERIMAEFDRIDVFFSNAGVAGAGTLGNIPAQDWDWITSVNFLGMAYYVTEVLPIMKKQGTDAYFLFTVSIGGGPAGMQAAIVLAERGFRPVLFERRAYLGGSAVLASKAPCKGLVAEYIETQKNQLAALGVQVELNHAPTMAELRRLDPYGVFVTMGGQQIVPDIPGIDRENVFGIEDILLGRRVIAGREVAVIGGGHVGLEVAHFLCANNQVTIVEMADEIGASVYYITKFKLLPLLREAGVTFRTGQAIAAVDDGGIRLRDTHTGQCTELKVEAVVLAMGSRPDLAARAEFDRNFDRVVYAGDAVRSGTMLEANRDAFALAWEF